MIAPKEIHQNVTTKRLQNVKAAAPALGFCTAGPKAHKQMRRGYGRVPLLLSFIAKCAPMITNNHQNEWGLKEPGVGFTECLVVQTCPATLVLQTDLWLKENLSTNLMVAMVRRGTWTLVISDVLLYKSHGPPSLGAKESNPKSICRKLRHCTKSTCRELYVCSPC